MRENHTPAAVSFELQFIEGIALKEVSKRNYYEWRVGDGPFAHVFCKELKIRIPFITNDLPT